MFLQNTLIYIQIQKEPPVTKKMQYDLKKKSKGLNTLEVL